jgi:NAD(P)-dependent dehydrogenase (short-subunit alcohol dehydrogenase family)
MRFALISGASTGLGRSIALQLVAKGVTVFAGVRRDADGESLVTSSRSASAGAELIPLKLDVTQQDQIDSAIQTVSQRTANDGLWALINNAGIVVPGPLEFLTPADWRRQFDVNFFGLIELTRLSLPLLRKSAAALGAGVPRLMLVSSIGGRVAQPILSPYTASKWATTALGDSLRLELKSQGIGVTILEPGAVATEIWGKGQDATTRFTPDHPARALYGPQIEGLAHAAQKAAQSAMPAERAADMAVNALFKPRAPSRVLVGTDAKIAALARKWLPLSWFDRILLNQFKP